MLIRFIAAVCVLVPSCYVYGQPVKFGIDNLIDTQFELLANKRIALVSHAAARAIDGRSTAEILARSATVTLTKILTPEHGFYGMVQAGKHVDDDTVFGVPTLSLYGAKRRPDRSMLSDIDVVVIDLQDIGVRSYTYISTMIEVMIACADAAKPVVVLDRPNPWGGRTVDGPVVDPSLASFIGRVPLAYVHGMTIGEIATMANAEGWLQDLKVQPAGQQPTRRCKLTVVKLKRWTRDMRWEDLGRPWYPTSPNIPTAASARAYAVTGLLGELGLANIGIGTSLPFTIVGTPTVSRDSNVVLRCRRNGVHLYDYVFVPPVGRFAKERCHGYVVDVQPSSRPVAVAMEIIRHVIESRASTDVTSVSNTAIAMFEKAVGIAGLYKALATNASPEAIESMLNQGAATFAEIRSRHLFYP